MKANKEKTYIVSAEVDVGGMEGHLCFSSRKEAQRWCDDFNRDMKDAIDDPNCGIEKATVIEIKNRR